jgi:hypothetical protein
MQAFGKRTSNETSVFLPSHLTDSAAFGRDKRDHEIRFRSFCTGTDHHRLRGLFRCRVDEC